jgi:hypothetical protein
MTDRVPPPDPSAAEGVVRGFLRDVRSGAHPDRAHRYLASRVQAHQGLPGGVRAVVERTPDGYAEHVREMLHAVGPWTFEVLGVRAAAGLVEAAWRQTGVVGAAGPDHGRPVVEHGRAAYLVERGRITQYWIDARQEVLPRAATGPPGGSGGA